MKSKNNNNEKGTSQKVRVDIVPWFIGSGFTLVKWWIQRHFTGQVLDRAFLRWYVKYHPTGKAGAIIPGGMGSILEFLTKAGIQVRSIRYQLPGLIEMLHEKLLKV